MIVRDVSFASSTCPNYVTRDFPAYASSSSYNLPIGLGCGYDSIQAAIAGLEEAEEGVYSKLEKDLIYALAARSTAESKAAMNPADMNFGRWISVSSWK